MTRLQIVYEFTNAEQFCVVRAVCFERDDLARACVLLLCAVNAPERRKLVGAIVLYCCRKGRLQTSGVFLLVVTNLRTHCFRRHALHLGLLYTCITEDAAKHTIRIS